MPLQIEDLKDMHGKVLIKLSRRAIRVYLESKEKITPPKDTPSLLREKTGVFTTLNTFKEGNEQLRGCIGIIQPRKALVKATIDSAINAATQDPRFPPLSEKELKDILIELTVLTPPQEINVEDPKEYLKKIKVGRDGLILKQGPFQGTLLPQVPVKHNWDVKEFLENLCKKAGLTRNCWKSTDPTLLAYQGKIWREKVPNGEIIAEKIQKKEE